MPLRDGVSLAERLVLSDMPPRIEVLKAIGNAELSPGLGRCLLRRLEPCPPPQNRASRTTKKTRRQKKTRRSGLSGQPWRVQEIGRDFHYGNTFHKILMIASGQPPPQRTRPASIGRALALCAIDQNEETPLELAKSLTLRLALAAAVTLAVTACGGGSGGGGGVPLTALPVSPTAPSNPTGSVG